MEDGFEFHQPFIVHLFEVFLEDDQDVQTSPLNSMHVALVQEHHPPFTDEKLSRSRLPCIIMEGTSPWADVPDEEPKTDAGAAPQPVSISDGFAPMNQNTMLTGTTQMPTGQLIYLQPPSSAAKVMGILLIIWGVLQGLGLLNLFVEPVDPMTGEIIDYPAAAKAMDGLSTVAGMVGFIAAGVFLTRYEKRGVWLAMGVIGAQFVLGMASFAAGTPDGGLGVDVRRRCSVRYLGGCFGLLFRLCALIVAIPLMVSNNGLQ